MRKSNMKEMILNEMKRQDESAKDIKSVKVFKVYGYRDVEKTEEANLDALDIEFNSGYGGEEGPRFFVWTEDRVYFKQLYDGSESIASVPRNPCDEKPAFIGGG